MKLRGRGILITGASEGLGRTIAQTCVAEGASVFLCARRADVLEQTRSEVAAQASGDQKVLAGVADVSRPEDVHRLVEQAGCHLGRLDGLINNAGVYGPKGLVEDVDWEEWVRALQIILLGTVLLCRAVLPRFRAQGYGKIVNLSGGGATAPLARLSAYAAAKAAVVRFTETLAEETRGAGIDVNAVAPGALNTRLLDEVLAAGPEQVGRAFYERAVQQKQEGGAPLERGAALVIFLLSAASDGISGRLISAVWDPWEALPARRAELEGSDVYTLRRITPADRGLGWG
jgi:3-oxoacyl-[acyl-carrier protein] reductase